MQSSTNVCYSKINSSQAYFAHKSSSGIFSSGLKSLKSKPNISSLGSNLPAKPADNFNFKHVSKPELEAIVKRVRRANQKKRDEEEWNCFLKLKQEQNSAHSCGSNLDSENNTNESSNCKDCGLIEPSPNLLLKQQEIEREENEVADNVIQPIIDNSTSGLNESHLYQLGGGLTKRLEDLLAMLGKMTSLLLSPCLQSQYEDEDVNRTIKRSQEFDAMFARNHLYEIQRLLKDTKQLISLKASHTGDLEAKISAALKSITQALQVYARHVSKGSRVKYQQVVPVFQSINTTLDYIQQLTGQRMFATRQEIEVACSYMRQVLLEMSVTETTCKSVSTASRVSTVRTQKHKHKPSSDLSMYSRRNRPDWRRKSAALARAKFGPPSAKKHRKTPTPKEPIYEKVKNSSSDLFVVNDKSQQQLKDLPNSKEMAYRSTTRAVPEEKVTTMMEMIPHETFEDSDLCLDDNAFEALTLLNSFPSQGCLKSSELVSTQESNKTDGEDCRKFLTERRRPMTAISSSKEASNVKLVYLIERDPKSKQKPAKDDRTNIEKEDNRKELILDERTKEEALEFHQKMMEYHQSNSNYKDNKATGIVDRLATNILSEMIMDFQNKEMDQVVQLLYKLEFE